jgi:hypothetical protein
MLFVAIATIQSIFSATPVGRCASEVGVRASEKDVALARG